MRMVFDTRLANTRFRQPIATRLPTAAAFAAAAAFLTGLKKYPKSTKAPDSMLKLGMTLAEMGQKKEACAALADIPNRYPSASLAIKQRAQKERQRVGCS